MSIVSSIKTIYLAYSCKSWTKCLAHIELRRDPLGKLTCHILSLVPQVSEDDASIITGMPDGTPDGLVNSLHAEALVVDLTRKTTIR